MDGCTQHCEYFKLRFSGFMAENCHPEKRPNTPSQHDDSIQCFFRDTPLLECGSKFIKAPNKKSDDIDDQVIG
jgi:hypothetical protein